MIMVVIVQWNLVIVMNSGGASDEGSAARGVGFTREDPTAPALPRCSCAKGPASAEFRCSGRELCGPPSVAVQTTCVLPRLKTADPCTPA